jgi:hypothetical protein
MIAALNELDALQAEIITRMERIRAVHGAWKSAMEKGVQRGMPTLAEFNVAKAMGGQIYDELASLVDQMMLLPDSVLARIGLAKDELQLLRQRASDAASSIRGAKFDDLPRAKRLQLPEEIVRTGLVPIGAQHAGIQSACCRFRPSRTGEKFWRRRL